MKRNASEQFLGHQNANGKPAFALVVALTLMSLFVLLALSLSSLTAVELRTSSIQRDMNHARENALLGMKTAIARLQETLGPDQRFTATSALIGESDQPYITGVWKKGATDAFTWLVSGNTTASPLAVSPSALPDPATQADGDEVFLVNLGSVSSVEQRIKVVKETVSQSSSPGHYAYWIGDEGVKVSVGINDEIDQLDYDNSRPENIPYNSPGEGHDWSEPIHRDELRQMTQSITNFWQLLGLEHEDVVNSSDLANVSTLSSSSLLPGSIDAEIWKDHFHTLTPLSRAVHIDHTTTNGSLKKDLSDSPQLTSSFKRFLRNRTQELDSGNRGHTIIPHSAASSGIFPAYSVGPVVTEFVVRYNFYRNYNGRLNVRQEMQVELWNPYATPIQSTSKVLLNLSDLPEMEVTVGGESYSVNLVDYFESGPYVPPGIEWEPGEIKWLKGSGGNRQLAVDGPSRSAEILDSSGSPIDIPEPTTAEPQSIQVSIPGLTGEADERITVSLDTQNDTIAEYRPNIAYLQANVSNASPSLSNSGWMFGYAFEMDDDLARWVDGSRTDAVDPRRKDMDVVDFADPDFEYWSDDPADTLGAINLAGSDTFNSQQRYILFDLPSQEPISIGALTHLISEKPHMLGNTWGGAANEYFDQYFISSLPRWHEWSLGSLPILPNRYIDFYLSGESNIEIGDPFAGTSADSDFIFDLQHAAKYLMVRGAFNVNSVSTDAWKSMLGGISISGWKQENAQSSTDLQHAFFRHSFGAKLVPTMPNEIIESATAYTRSGVTLTTAQVDALANAVVTIILDRGRPYESLSEFINAGVIAQAIEDAQINLEATELGIANNSPAMLTQADVIKTIAPMLTPRSDTFLIRSYGDVVDPFTGETTAQVWCEAVVQRVPSLTSPATGVLAPATDPLAPSPTKFPFGREMKVLSFRYLTPDEV
ncbi:hypothetical protein [Cerasicoccus frondis]|uniref:hypothetical protein n=1 Tax=Cerasicoccus frondis TaxID=490090 RepID=UPI0028525E89|nr:hypothetical protein [Cerasicoccus frondis]